MDLAKRGDGFRRDEQLIEGYPGIIKPALFLRFPLSAAGADSQRRHRKNSLAADRRRNRRERTDSRKSKIHGLCIFTGTLGFKRNLTAGEIFEQVVRAQQAAEAQGQPLSNIVFMGMGEPLLNYEQVLRAIERITAQDGLAMSPYRITVSTAGIPEKIRQLADDGVRFNLALSLHAAKETTRTFLMPVNKAYPLSEIAGSLKYFVEKTGTRPTFEYLLLKDINDSLEDAKALALYCRQFPIKINIIEYNNVEGSGFQHSPDKNRDAFIRFLEGCNMVVNVRRSKGKDIDAACGQLAGKQESNL